MLRVLVLFFGGRVVRVSLRRVIEVSVVMSLVCVMYVKVVYLVGDMLN